MAQSTFSFRYVGLLVLLFFAYVVGAKIGLSLYTMHGFGALIWPPTGIALAALFFGGYDLWAAVACGAFAAAIFAGASVPVALGMATGSTLEALAGAYILRDMVTLDPLFKRMRDSLGMIVTSITVTVLGATIGVVSLVWGGGVTFSEVPHLWLAWWFGDFLSALVLAPFLILWFWEPRFVITPQQLIERGVAFGSLLFAIGIVFFGPFGQLHGLPLIYVLPPLLWISLRANPRGLTLANMIITIGALVGTLSGHGIFAQGNVAENLLLAQIFIAVISIIFFIFTSTVEERKEAERELALHVGTLEHTVEQISSEDKAKTDFLAILAHELRNPLSPIVSALELIKINGTRPQNTMLFETIETQVHTIGRLLDDLLDISRITHKKFRIQKESIRLQSVIYHSLETVRPFMKDRGHTLLVSLPKKTIWIDGDAVRVVQVFVNILYNAAKYTNSGGKISITCKQEPGFVQVMVADTGIGIEPHMVTKIFEPFVQASGASEVGTGLGIGLALTKRLVELHHGTISVVSEGKGKGSVFTVTLPVLDIVQLPMSVPSLQEVELKNKEKRPFVRKTYRLLIVDDNEIAAHSLQTLLLHSGHKVEVVHTGRETLAYVALHHPEVIILDIGLPDMSGYEVAERLRKTEAPSALLIALSGYGQKEDKQKAFKAGFNHHLTKPIRVKDVEDLLYKKQRQHITAV